MIRPMHILNELSDDERGIWIIYHDRLQDAEEIQRSEAQCIAAEGALKQALRIIEESSMLRDNFYIQERKEHIRLVRREVRRTRENNRMSTRGLNNARAAAYETFNNQEIAILTQAQQLIDERDEQIED